MPIISVTNLTKTFSIAHKTKGFWNTARALFSRKYDIKHALDHVSFSINEGELVGYIGPNGAGKSTTVKILSGILVPDGGEVHVLGKTPWQNRIETVKHIGVIFGQRTQLCWDLPVLDSFELLRAIYAIDHVTYEQQLAELINTLDLSALLSIPVRQLSLGQRMRCDIAASLLHKPKILFLDEPTIGLDAISKLAVRDFIRKLNQEHKVTIMLTTHDMDDIEALCTRVLIINEGKIFLDGTLDYVRQHVAPERQLIVDLVDAQDTITDPAIRLIKQEGHRVWLEFNPSTIKTPELISRITAQHAVSDLFVQNLPIDELIVKLYRNVR